MSRRQWILMGLLAATWGASYLFIKIGLRDFSAPAIVCLRTALAAAVLIPIARHRRALGQLVGRGRSVLVLALLQVVVPFLLITVGEHHIDSALAGILVAGAPIFTALLAFTPYAAAERASPAAIGGVVLGMVGVTLLFGVDLTGSSETLIAGAMVLGAALFYSLGAIEVRRRMTGVDPVAVASATMATSAVLTLPATLLTLPDSAGADAIAAIVALGVLGTGVAFGLYYTLIADIGAMKAGLVAYLAPGFAILYGALFLSEDVGPAAIGGLVLILAGSYLGAGGQLPLRRRAPAPPPPEPAPPAVVAGR